MIPKGHRLLRQESSRADREGFRVSAGPLQGRVLHIPQAPGPRGVVIAGKKASQSSVERHSIRRRVSDALEQAFTTTGFRGDIVVRVRENVTHTPFETLVEQCSTLLLKQ